MGPDPMMPMRFLGAAVSGAGVLGAGVLGAALTSSMMVAAVGWTSGSMLWLHEMYVTPATIVEEESGSTTCENPRTGCRGDAYTSSATKFAPSPSGSAACPSRRTANLFFPYADVDNYATILPSLKASAMSYTWHPTRASNGGIQRGFRLTWRSRTGVPWAWWISSRIGTVWFSN